MSIPIQISVPFFAGIKIANERMKMPFLNQTDEAKKEKAKQLRLARLRKQRLNFTQIFMEQKSLMVFTFRSIDLYSNTPLLGILLYIPFFEIMFPIRPTDY
jgi:hypothetical protein